MEICNLSQAIREEGEARGRVEGKAEGTIRTMLKYMASVPEISEEVSMTVDELRDFCNSRGIVLP